MSKAVALPNFAMWITMLGNSTAFTNIVRSFVRRNKSHHAALGLADGCDHQHGAFLNSTKTSQAQAPRDVIHEEGGEGGLFRHENPYRRFCLKRRDPQPADFNRQAARQPALVCASAWRENLGLGRQKGRCQCLARGRARH